MDSLTEIWSDEPDDDDHSSTNTKSNIPWQLKAILIFILAWQFSFGVSSAAFVSLLLFLQKLFKLLGTYYNGGILQELSLGFPKTRNAALQTLGIGLNTFEQYIVCPCCNAIYDYELEDGNDEASRKCYHVEFPYHPYASMREPCGSLLMKTFRANTSFIRVKPFKVFAYQSLKKAMTNLLNTNGFLENCEHWRNRKEMVPSGCFSDIYDGNIWHEFQVVDGVKFLETNYNFCFTLNLDWFQPYTHTRKLYIIGYKQLQFRYAM